MKVYLDNCCLNRPYDNLNQDMVRMEAEAVLSIMDRCESGEWEFWGSDVLYDEIDNTPDRARKQKLLMLFRSASGNIGLSDEIVSRAKELEQVGIKPYDALHLASAEAGEVDIFLTTDLKLINLAQKSDARVMVKNPLVWLAEVLYN